MEIELGKIYNISSGGTPSKKCGEYYKDGNIKWVKTGDLKAKYLYDTDECITEKGLQSSSAKLYGPDTVLIAMYGATIGATSILKLEACTNQACAAFCKNDKIVPEYLYYFFKSQKEKFIKDGVGGAQPNISIGYLRNIRINLISIDEQREIVESLGKIEELICNEQEQIRQFDILIKSRFVEMFGEPERNNKDFPVLSMTEVCEIIDGDRGKNYPKQDELLEDGYCLFLNAKNVTASGFSFDKCMFITKEKDKILRNGHLDRGDVVLTTRGTIGNLAYYDDSIPYENVRINSGMVILRMRRDVVLELFLIEQFKMQLVSIKEKIASGSAQPQLPISTMNKIKMLIPTLEEQKQYTTFVHQIDKLKLTAKERLKKLEIIQKALMQQYFGS